MVNNPCDVFVQGKGWLVNVIFYFQITSRVLCQTIEPEEKRKIVGDTFMKIVDDEAKEMGLTINDCYLAQGRLQSI